MIEQLMKTYERYTDEVHAQYSEDFWNSACECPPCFDNSPIEQAWITRMYERVYKAPEAAAIIERAYGWWKVDQLLLKSNPSAAILRRGIEDAGLVAEFNKR